MNKQRGITLIELLIAATILASILVIVERSISTAHKSAEVSQARVQSLRDLDRVFLLLENDLRNAIAQAYQGQFRDTIPAMIIDSGEEYQLMFLRGGQKNPLMLPRTELQRVAYRLEDEVLWRDSWVDPYNNDEDIRRSQQLLENVEELEILALPKAPRGRSVREGPWVDSWPEGNANPSELPIALEFTLRLNNGRELKRLIGLAPGA